MSDLKPTHDAIAKLVATVRQAQLDLDQTIFAACPGRHLPRQHRDSRPAWCAACGYTANGDRVKNIVADESDLTR